MKVMYLTWGETPRSSGVYGSQVVTQLSNIQALAQHSHLKLNLVAGVPLIHSGLIREKLKYPQEILSIKENIEPLKFKKITLYSPQNFINKPTIGFYTFHLLANKKLLKLIKEVKPDIVHCRSYHAAYAAVKAKEKGNLNYKIIFDARGLWPEQYAVAKKAGKEHQGYKKLKIIERYIIKKSDCIVSVSEPMTNHYQKMGIPSSLLKTIYPSCPNSHKTQNSKVPKNGEYTFCYLGALNENTWHKPSVLSQLFSHLLNIFPQATLKIISKDKHAVIASFFSDQQRKNMTFLQSSNAQELQQHLKGVDIGILSYFLPKEELELDFANTVMAIKTGEYLSSGIPVLVNKYCGGAATYVKKNGLGVSYNPETFAELTKKSLESICNKKSSIAAKEHSEKDFSYSGNAKKYITLYQSIFNAEQ